jgi:hypothetical protein
LIVLDTSFLIDYFTGVETTRNIIEDDVAITAINYHEIMTGIKNKQSRKEKRFFKHFFSQVRILPYDIQSADESSEIASRLRKAGIIVNTLDILIAGIAIANGIIQIVSADTHFKEIEKVTDIQVVTY